MTNPEVDFQLGVRIRRYLGAALFAWAMAASSGVRAESWVKSDPQGVPEELKAAGITEKLGAQVDIDHLVFTNEQGQKVPLSTYFHGGKPVLLSLVYYECPNLCHYLLNGMLSALKEFEWTVGNQFEVVTISINHRETAKLAAAKKQAYLKEYGRADGNPGAGWHFLVGDESQIEKLASQVGFGYRYDQKTQEYAHSAAIMALTPTGKVSRYLYGVQFPKKDLRLALVEASDGKVGTVLDRVLLFCYHYDPSSRGYAVHAFRVVQAGGAGTLLLVGGYMFLFWRRQRRGSGKRGLKRND